MCRLKTALVSLLTSTIPLIALGIARTWILNVFGQPAQIIEYGVHWNFFFTLCAVQV